MSHLFRNFAFCLLGFSSASVAITTHVFVMVNDAWKGRVAITFTGPQQPCLTAPLLSEWGMLYERAAALDASNSCVTPQALRQHAIKSIYNHEAQLLTLEIPPTLLSKRQNGIAPSRWDEGINAAFLDYQLSYTHATGDNYRGNDRQHSLSLSLTQGVNLGPWRFRYQPIFQKETWGAPEWYTERAVVFRSLRDWRSSLYLGDNVTSSDLFDSVTYRGISIESDERMLPDDLRTFSPRLRGYAHSNAQVKVSQNGTVIYQTQVPPGAFVLRGVYPIAPSGDLTMTVKESDGTETVRTLPWSAMPGLVHKDQWKYAFVSGKYRPWHGVEEEQPWFVQGSLHYGMSHKFTLYGGVQAADIYRSGVWGVGKSLGRLGAASLDYNFAAARDPRRREPNRGSMVRLRYAKAFPEWESSLSLLAHYYSGRYRTFSDSIAQRTTYWWDWEDGRFIGEFEPEKKQRLEARYNQYLSETDSLSLTLVRETLRGGSKGQTRLELDYNGSWGDVDYTLYADYSSPQWGKEQAQIALSFSVPLDALSLPRLKLQLEQSLAKNGQGVRSLGLSGTALNDYSLSYYLGTSQHQQGGSSQDASVDYLYNGGELHLGYSQGTGYRQQTADIRGSVVASAEGVVFGQPLGETLAIISVPGTAGIGVDNQYGVTTDRHGAAVVSYLTPYRVNQLTLSSWDLPEGMSLPQSEDEVVPTAGAIMFSRFEPPIVE